MAFHLFRHSYHLVLECAPLHTEKPEWAVHAPAQVEAACKRGADVIGLTETRGPEMAQCKAIAEAHGYAWLQAAMDAHRNVTLLVKKAHQVVNVQDVVVNNNHRVAVTFKFHGNLVTVFVTHWEKFDNEHKLTQTDSLVSAMTEASKGSHLAFYMGDTNPSKPQHVPGSEPSTALHKAGMPTIFQELGHFPPNIGVNVIGHSAADTRVKPVKVETHPSLGSDHIPATATYSVKRPRRSRKS